MKLHCNLHSDKLMWQLQLICDSNIYLPRGLYRISKCYGDIRTSGESPKSCTDQFIGSCSPRDDDAGLGLLAAEMTGCFHPASGSSHLRKRRSRFTNRCYLNKLTTYLESTWLLSRLKKYLILIKWDINSPRVKITTVWLKISAMTRRSGISNLRRIARHTG